MSTLLFVLIGLAIGVAPSAAATIQASWQPSPTATGYKVYYGTASRVYDVVVDVGPATSASLGEFAPGTYYLAATAYNAAGESDYSNEGVKTILAEEPPDTTAPAVSIVSPVDGSTVPRKGQVTVEATVEDASPVTVGFWFMCNHQPWALICTVTSPPYQCVWTVPAAGGNKVYALRATAEDNAGNQGQSALVQVTAR